jgi:enoyl-CoA hydratase
MTEAILLVEKKEGVAKVTLNRPDSLNALSTALVAEICGAFEELAKDDEVRVAILTGAGRAFSAGVDLKELGSGSQETRSVAGGNTADRLVEAFAGFPSPIIGAINGYAITGGFELALMCDILIASTNARFADTHARVGIAPGWGLSQKLPRLIGISRAKELHFTGNFLEADRAERWGLVNRVVEPDELLPVCEELAREMLSCDARTLRTYKRVVDEGYATTFSDGLQLESKTSKEHMKGVTAAAVEARRSGIQERGRSQDSGGS